jgi:hypothetical protein
MLPGRRSPIARWRSGRSRATLRNAHASVAQFLANTRELLADVRKIVASVRKILAAIRKNLATIAMNHADIGKNHADTRILFADVAMIFASIASILAAIRMILPGHRDSSSDDNSIVLLSLRKYWLTRSSFRKAAVCIRRASMAAQRGLRPQPKAALRLRSGQARRSSRRAAGATPRAY